MNNTAEHFKLKAILKGLQKGKKTAKRALTQG
jgi:hypothetical protein